ncbi:RES family NAD+ phosphorylase [Rhodococcus sp. IEGM 1318]|uniref:RES family NAD+ phosphorylase n=1 Tax=Rhodococcus sp. IEGM 1318 TaxID=3082226 RepID=UPI00295560B8|nr:RES family NAD+ phosphorylase [Rhodococcus sp. IEGM 1318]MDV8006980.1 RES family NAD+ phosphorylase [Rhodococcus sp. IEGM 1318]
MSAPRAVQHLSAPPSPDELRGRFPARTVSAGTVLYRTHRDGLGAWWFGSSLQGRFDLTDPHGTCYTAESELITLLECWVGIKYIPRTEIDDRALSAVTVRRDLQIADVTSNRAIEFGMTSEINTTIDYTLTQRWAEAFRSAGFDGIRYWARHEMSHTDACLALFAEGGDRTHSTARPSDYAVTTADALADRDDLWTALERETGIQILDIPGTF